MESIKVELNKDLTVIFKGFPFNKKEKVAMFQGLFY